LALYHILMESIIHQFWLNEPWKQDVQTTELECRFGYIAPLTRIDYDNAMTKLKSLGFTCSPEQSILRVAPMKGDQSLPNRLEIRNAQLINNYIEKKQSILEIARKNPKDVSCQVKEYTRDSSFNPIKPVFIPDYNFKISFTVEKELDTDQFIDCFKQNETRIFRIIKRISFSREDFPFMIDFSIIYTYRGVHFKKDAATKTYEIEIEVDNAKIKDKCSNVAMLTTLFRKLIVYILCGIQKSNFHISCTERDDVLHQYQSMAGERKFIGSNCQTIQIDSDIVTVDYSVTEKADGERHLLYVSKSGRIYLIQQRQQIIFTGCCVKKEKFFETILDGELILHTKDGVFINMFAFFDIYFLKAKDVRNMPFSKRFPLLKTYTDEWSPVAVTGETEDLPMTFLVKRFLFPTKEHDIFKCSASILDSSFMYAIDGLIFTPLGDNRLPFLKWKFETQNTIDFAVKVLDEKDSEILLGLHCGYTNAQLLLDPKAYILNQDEPVSAAAIKGHQKYTIKQFVPTNPYNEHAAYTCVTSMVTEDGQPFHDGDIVEFTFIDSKWLPKRIRNDKTAPNNFQTANSNWTFIHFPVTETMIRTQISSGTYSAGDLYYNRDNHSELQSTKNLRNFHNDIKRELLGSVAKKTGMSLIDFGCGKGGDLHKWIFHKFKTVFGIDKSEDNIVNTKDGCYARYLPQKEKLFARFVHGDASKDLVNGDATFKKAEFEIWQSLKCRMFDIASCQFALHYFFKNEVTITGFMRNVYNTVNVGGFFIGCCFDGKKVFDKLQSEDVINCNDLSGNRIWMLQKRYKKDSFPDDITSVGYKIDVFQESINSVQEEFLVNFDFLTSAMEQIGFFPVKDDNFEAFYKDTYDLSPMEKEISFLNRAFIFQKKTKISNIEICRFV